MADEFHTGIGSTVSWWNTGRNATTFDVPLISCSAAIRDISDDSINWSQPFLPYYRQEEPIKLDQIQTGFGDSSENPLRDMNDQAFLPVLFESNPLKDMNESVQPSRPKFNHQQRASSPPKQQLHFSNNTPFWNPSACSERAKLVEPRFEDEPSYSSLTNMKSNSEGVLGNSSSYLTVKTSSSKKNGSEPAIKKRRIETPSPLPTFKVRKEKLGDRITALQQLVSPFGKTDTASVLHEAIDYIKFLHNQVGVLSTPYLKDGHQMQHHKSLERLNDGEKGPNQDLISRGLCLVPISSTFAVASKIPMDFWTPTFGGSYR